MTKLLNGRLALVTGGTRGIGAEVARRLLLQGAAVNITGKNPPAVPLPGAKYFAVDFADRSATEAFAREVCSWGVDILINNAGINKIGPFDQLVPADFDRIQEVNVRAPFLLCQAVLPSMRRKTWGRIVNISSIWGKISMEHRASYSASKFALDGMTVALAAEVAKDGILANCVAPGVIDTELSRTVLGEEGIARMKSKIPAGRLGTVEEVAAFIVWLSSGENTYISGQNIAIDGGVTRV